MRNMTFKDCEDLAFFELRPKLICMQDPANNVSLKMEALCIVTIIILIFIGLRICFAFVTYCCMRAMDKVGECCLRALEEYDEAQSNKEAWGRETAICDGVINFWLANNISYFLSFFYFTENNHWA